MELPNDKPVFQDELAFYWMEGDLLCSIAKSTPRTSEKMRETFELIEEITGGKKPCFLTDISATGSRSDETRAISGDLSAKAFKAMAMISTTSFGKMIVHSFITVSGEPIPMQLFTDEQEAREWLKQYI